MKKEILLCLAGICVLLSLCGCADRPQSEVKQRQRLIIGSDNYIPYNYRDDDGRYQGIDVELAKEVGDVLWYIATLAHDIGFTLEEIGQMNYEKLHSRQQRGMLGGSGDNR